MQQKTHPPSQSEKPSTTIFKAVRIRRETDRIMSPLWVLAPLFGIALSIVVAILGLTAITTTLSEVTAMLLAVGYLVATVLSACPLYFLIKRRSEHFYRDGMLRNGIIQHLKAKSERARREKSTSSEIATMNLLHTLASGEETSRSPMIWVIFAIIVPFASLYVLYFLTRDPKRHENRQYSFVQQTQSSMSKLGTNIAVPWKSLPERSFFLYLLLTFITSGLFEIYWYYALITDFNEHYRAQWQFEDQLVAAIS